MKLTVPVYKVLLIGEPNVGKSSIIRQFLLGEFDDNYHATAGVDLSAVAINLDAFTPVILTIIDLGGQDDFSSLRTQYYKGAHYSVLVYDIADRKSFECLPEWYAGILQNIDNSETGHSTLPGLLIGNKNDLESEREVSTKDGRIYADLIGWQFWESSAKTGANLKEIFNRIAKEIFSNHPPK
ncbi:MAG: GTP-binding protein [Candidatus Thorarchaeota archaeon]|nr:GTP-binding protein [Candidatus Thorarchaeota archaeon]